MTTANRRPSSTTNSHGPAQGGLRGVRRYTTAAVAGFGMLAIAACSSATPPAATTGTGVPASPGTVTSAPEATPSTDAGAATGATTGTDVNANTSVVDLSQVDTHYDADDLVWNTADEQSIALSDAGSTSSSDAVTVNGSTVTITAAGVYRISGSLSDGQLIVAEPNDDRVTLILDGVNIANNDGTAIGIESANEVAIVLQDGTTNTVSDGDDYEVANDLTPVAAIAAGSDLTIAGTGTLNVTGNANDGISSNDGLVIISGNITVTGSDDAVRGKDYVTVAGGTLDLTSEGDSLKADNFEDADRGWVLIADGNVSINSGDDGIDAERAIRITGGTVNVAESVEGLEAQTIMLDGGTVTVNASDDGINATAATTPEEAAAEEAGEAPAPETRSDDGSVLSITGGTVNVTGGDDGLDSNGSISITGGDITISSPQSGRGTGPIDANGSVTIENVTVVANGESIDSASDL